MVWSMQLRTCEAIGQRNVTKVSTEPPRLRSRNFTCKNLVDSITSQFKPWEHISRFGFAKALPFPLHRRISESMGEFFYLLR